MLISVQYQVSPFLKPSVRLTGCISPDGLTNQPLTSHGTIPPCYILGCFDTMFLLRKNSTDPNRNDQLIISHLVSQGWSWNIFLLDAKLFYSRKASGHSSCAHPPASYHPTFLQVLFLLHLLSTNWFIISLCTLYIEKAFFFLSLFFLIYNHWKILTNTSESNYTRATGVALLM